MQTLEMGPDVTTLDEIESPADVGLPAFRWTVCALLFAATTINYMDRQVLGLLAPMLQKQIGWNEVQYGHIVIAFQAAYAIGLVGFGRLIDRWGTRKGYAASIVVWSLAAAAHALAHSVRGFSLARFSLGLGESGNFPAAIKTVAEWFPKRERALATGLFNCGSNMGAILAPLIVPPIALYWGWQAAFIAMGAAGFIWIAFWMLLYTPPEKSRHVTPEQLALLHEQTVTAEPTQHASVSWSQLARFRQTWACCLPGLFVSPIWWFYLYWLPKFFDSRYGLSISKSSVLLAMIYAMSLVGSIGGGILPAMFLRRNKSLNFSRKISLLACVLLTIPMTQVNKIDNLYFATFLIGLAAAGMQGWSANSYTMTSDLFPKRAVASIVGLASAFGSVASIVLAEVVGKTLENTGSYQIPFLIAGLSMPVAWVLTHLLAPRWEAAEM